VSGDQVKGCAQWSGARRFQATARCYRPAPLFASTPFGSRDAGYPELLSFTLREAVPGLPFFSLQSCRPQEWNCEPMACALT